MQRDEIPEFDGVYRDVDGVLHATHIATGSKIQARTLTQLRDRACAIRITETYRRAER